MTLYTSPSQVSYGVSFVNILKRNYPVIIRFGGMLSLSAVKPSCRWGGMSGSCYGWGIHNNGRPSVWMV